MAFNRGEENSPNETRAFMDKLRDLSNRGATVLVLHHTGKSEGSKVYRGSSDYKASVDMAYLLKSLSNRNGALDRLSLKCFKGRMAPGKNLELEFREGKGFVGREVDNPAPRRSDLEIVREILCENPQINQSEIVERAQQQGLSKHKVEECLNNGGFGWTRGKGNTKLYHLKDSPGSEPEEEPEGDLPNSHSLEEGISGNQLYPLVLADREG